LDKKSAGLPSRKDPLGDGQRNCVDRIAGAKLLARVGDMVLGGLDTDGQLVRDPFRAFPAGEQAQALDLAWRQASAGHARWAERIGICGQVIHIATIGVFHHEIEE
jgi:hypothetical protein